MAFKTIASFETLAAPVAPGIADVPYVQQGFFLQISNLETSSVHVDIEYVATPAFTEASGAAKLFTNVIDQTGTPSQYSTATFLTAPIGFKAQVVPPLSTFLFGVQYLLLPPPAPTTSPATGATPQDAVEARGYVRLRASAGKKVLALATVRQVFNNYSPGGVLIDVAEGAYAVPLAGGPEYAF